MHLLKYFKALSLKPENTKELRGLVLDLAIWGRLTAEWRKEHPEVEPASVLLERIKEEKKRLVKEKKIKKAKPLPEIEKEEIPIEVPEGWVWCRFGNIITFLNGYAFKSTTYVESSNYQVIRLGNVKNDRFLIEEKQAFVPEEIGLGVQEYRIQKGDILTTLTGTKGKRDYCFTCLVKRKHIQRRTLLLNQRVGCIRPMDKSSSGFLNKFLKTKIILTQLFNTESGTANQGNIGSTAFKNLIFPLPPLPEQQAIVQVVDQLMGEIDQLEAQTRQRIQLRQDYVGSALHQLTTSADSPAAWSALAPHFKDFFDSPSSIDRLKEAILQLAVQGKLTAQWRQANPNVEPASVLLERIQAEKLRLIQEKKIKKEKPLPEIEKAEIPFEVPEGWVWCRMGEICPNISSGSTPPKAYFRQSGIPYLKVYNIRNQKIDFAYRKQYIDSEYHMGKLKRSILHPGDVIMNIVGPPLGKTAIIPDEFPEWNCNQAITFFKPIVKEMNYWLHTFLRSKIYLKEIELIGTAGQDNISVTKSKNIKISLPPLREQQAIVQIVDQLFTFCDRLQEALATRDVQAGQFLQAGIREVMEGGVSVN